MLVFNKSKCSGCRICMLTCSSVKYGIYNLAKSKIQISTHKDDSEYRAITCIQCGKCYDVCPVEAIEKVEGERNYILHEDICIQCGLCRDVCPTDAIIVYGEDEIFMKCDICGSCVENCPQDALSIRKRGSKKA